MMNLSAEILQEIEKYAEALLSPEDIAIIIELDTTEFLSEVLSPGTPAYKAFMKGKLITEAKLNKAIIAIANQGSSPAQTLVRKMVEEQNLKLFNAARE